MPLSPDRRHYWDGTAWQTVSPDGLSYWSGTAWLPIPLGFQPAAAAPPPSTGPGFVPPAAPPPPWAPPRNTTAWHRRRGWIIALGFLFPPLGLFWLWTRRPFARN